MTRLPCVILVTIGLCWLLTACGSQPTAKKPRVALIMKSLSNEFFKTMEDGARAHAAAHTADYELRASGIGNEQDVAGQIKLVNDMIGQQVDAIVIAPADSKSLIPVCKKAIADGIIVINIDNRFDSETLAQNQTTIPFVGPDNRAGAKLAGDYLAAKLNAGDKVIIVEGLPTAYNAQQRKAGFSDAIAAKGLVLGASQTGKWETDEARKIISGLLPGHADVKAILCANDSMAVGAAAALRAVDRGDVLVVGFDNIKAVQDLIRQDRVLCTVDQHGDQIAVFGIEHALAILAKKATAGDKGTAVDLVTKATLK